MSSDTELDHVSSQPLFSQVKAAILETIRRGDTKPGERIPPEPQLAETYGVSRITVRRAISDLCTTGYLVKRQGKGTFVKDRRVSRKIEHIASFTESCLASGMTPTARVTHRESVSALPMPVTPSTEFSTEGYLYIQRIHYADGTAVMIENNYYPRPRFDFLDDEPLEGSLFRTLGAHGIRICRGANSYLDADIASRETAEQLDILAGDPIFVFGREMLDSEGRLIYIARQLIAASRYRFVYDRV